MKRTGIHPSSLPDDIKTLVAFDAVCEYGQLRFDENKHYPLLMLKLSYIPGVILGKYFVRLTFNDEKYDEMKSTAKIRMGKEMIESLMPEEVKKKYEQTLADIEAQRQLSFKENPEMKFFVDFYKYETKEYTNKSNEFWMTFSIAIETAMMIIEKKSKFEDYKVSFECPDRNNQEQVATHITLSIQEPGSNPSLPITTTSSS